MAVRFGRNPALNQGYFGKQTDLAQARFLASGALSSGAPQLGGGTSVRHVTASGALLSPKAVLQDIPIQIVRRRGPGALSAGRILIGTTTQLGHSSGIGALVGRGILSGTAVRHLLAGGDQFNIAADLSSGRSILAGTAIISRLHVTGSGALSSAASVLASDEPMLPDITDIEGIFEDPDIYGILLDPFDIEGFG